YVVSPNRVSTDPRKDVKYQWSSKQETTFQALKEKLTTAPVVAYPNFSQ
ncbi:15870_t:CDS:2, partial [Racocetra fulgida]